MSIGALTFLSPWLLGGLLALPVIYWLLRTVPPRPRAETLRRLLAYEAQAHALGSLAASETRMLRSIASGNPVGDVAAQATPGTHLVREWNGRTYRVEVTDNGYRRDGMTYRSLSAVAKRITGTARSGPRFFELTGSRSA